MRNARQHRAVTSLVALLTATVSSSASAAPGALAGKSLGLGSALIAWVALQAPEGLGLGGVAALLAAALLLPWWLARRGVAVGWRRAMPAPAGSQPLVQPAAPPPAVEQHGELLALARKRFVQLQGAWDARDLPVLRELTTPEMFEELVALRDALAASPARTEVLTLDARLLALESLGAFELASLEFSGFLRESPDRAQVPFRELWMLARSRRDDGCWRLARQQTLL